MRWNPSWTAKAEDQGSSEAHQRSHDAVAEKLPRVSIIVPCRNEARFIGQCLSSIVQNDYPREKLEVLVVDGMSADQTWEIATEFAAKHPFIRLLRNPRQITPAALNLGIRNATGSVILRVDAHALVAKDYVRRCVEALDHYAADNVGGAMTTLPGRETLSGRAIALAMSGWFGAGDSKFRIGAKHVIETDTVFGGCFRREVFERVGLYNENLVRTQDLELNCRIRRNGGRIVLDPAIKSFYYASPDLLHFARHNFLDGIWAILPFAFCEGIPVRWRHLLPLILTACVIGLSFGSLASSVCGMVALALMAAYLLLNISCSATIAVREREVRLAFVMPLVFFIRHFLYGFGSLAGVFCLVWTQMKAFPKRSSSDANRKLDCFTP